MDNLNEQRLKALYDGVSKYINIGSYDKFASAMTNPERRKNFYEKASEHVDIGSYDDFESKILKKKDQSIPFFSRGYQRPDRVTQEDVSLRRNRPDPQVEKQREESNKKNIPENLDEDTPNPQYYSPESIKERINNFSKTASESLTDDVSKKFNEDPEVKKIIDGVQSEVNHWAKIRSQQLIKEIPDGQLTQERVDQINKRVEEESQSIWDQKTQEHEPQLQKIESKYLDDANKDYQLLMNNYSTAESRNRERAIDKIRENTGFLEKSWNSLKNAVKDIGSSTLDYLASAPFAMDNPYSGTKVSRMLANEKKTGYFVDPSDVGIIKLARKIRESKNPVELNQDIRNIDSVGKGLGFLAANAINIGAQVAAIEGTGGVALFTQGIGGSYSKIIDERIAKGESIEQALSHEDDKVAATANGIINGILYTAGFKALSPVLKGKVASVLANRIRSYLTLAGITAVAHTADEVGGRLTAGDGIEKAIKSLKKPEFIWGLINGSVGAMVGAAGLGEGRTLLSRKPKEFESTQPDLSIKSPVTGDVKIIKGESGKVKIIKGESGKPIAGLKPKGNTEDQFKKEKKSVNLKGNLGIDFKEVSGEKAMQDEISKRGENGFKFKNFAFYDPGKNEMVVDKENVPRGQLVHERAHDLYNIVRKTNPDLYNKVLDSVEKDPELKDYVDYVKKHYSDKSREDQLNEALTFFTQKKGIEFLDSQPEKKQTIIDKIKDYLRQLVEAINPALKKKDILNVTYGDLLDIKGLAEKTAKSITSGKETNLLIDTDQSKTGKAFSQFFQDVSAGKRGYSDIKYNPFLDIKDKEGIAKFVQEYVKHRGNFDEHIAKSIPGFREVQAITGNAVLKSLPDGGDVLDIGGSENSWAKAISSLSDGKIKTTTLDPNPEMKKFSEGKSNVPGNEYVDHAFMQGWTEENGKEVPTFEPNKKYDIVHESMVFQFINNERPSQIGYIKDNLIKPDGVFITEEKFTNPDWQKNEDLKDKYKGVYFTPEELAKKKKDILAGRADKAEGMNSRMSNLGDFKKVLNDNFKYVKEYWENGNFRGYMASDSKESFDRVDKHIGKIPGFEETLNNWMPESQVGSKSNNGKKEYSFDSEGVKITQGLEKAHEIVGDVVSKRLGKKNKNKITLYHYSEKPLDMVSVGKPANNYSQQEFRTWGRPRSFFYVNPASKESLIAGKNSLNTVSVDPREIYPIEEDPLGLMAKAENISNPKGKKLSDTWINVYQDFGKNLPDDINKKFDNINKKLSDSNIDVKLKPKIDKTPFSNILSVESTGDISKSNKDKILDVVNGELPNASAKIEPTRFEYPRSNEPISATGDRNIWDVLSNLAEKNGFSSLLYNNGIGDLVVSLKNLKTNKEKSPDNEGALSFSREKKNKDGDKYYVAQEHITENPNFQKWFGDSKVKDKDGDPIVMFHGTNKDFHAFNADKGINAKAIFLTPKPAFAEAYAGDYWESVKQSHGGHILPVLVKSDNPFDYKSDADIKRLYKQITDTYDPFDIEGITYAKFKNGIENGNWASLEHYYKDIKDSGFDSFFIKENGVKNLAVFDPAQVKSATGNKGEFSSEHTALIFSREKKGNVGWKVKLTKTANDILNSNKRDEKTKAIREDIGVNESLYEKSKQNISELKANLHNFSGRQLSDIIQGATIYDLTNKVGSDNILGLALQEQMNRSAAYMKNAENKEDVARGKEALLDTFRVYNKVMSNTGQLLRQAAELKSSTPFGIVQTINAALRSKGYELSDQQTKDLSDLATKYITATRLESDLAEQARGKITEEKLKEAEKAKDSANKYYNELVGYSTKLIPKGSDLFGLVMAMNMLTGKSSATNVFANTANVLLAPVKPVEDFFGDVTETIHQLITEGKFIFPFPHAVAKGTAAWITGWKEAGKVSFQGFDPELNDRLDMAGSINGFRTWVDLVNAVVGGKKGRARGVGRWARKAGKNYAASPVVFEKMFEGIFGLTGDLMSRSLSFGDVPFRRGAEAAESMRIALRKGIKSNIEYRRFLLTMSDADKARIKEAGKRTIFSGDRFLSRNVSKMLGLIGNVINEKSSVFGPTLEPALKAIGKTLLKANAPYVKVPVNLMQKLTELAIPAIPVTEFFAKVKSDPMAAGRALGTAVAGTSLFALSTWIYNMNAISTIGPDADSIERGLKYSMGGRSGLNVSKVHRAIMANLYHIEDPDFINKPQKGTKDLSINYNVLGPAGLYLGWYSMMRDEMHKKGIPFKGLNSLYNPQMWMVGLRSAADNITNQTFMQGAAALRDQIFKGSNKYMTNLENALSNIVIPNNLVSLRKGKQKYKINANDEKLWTAIRSQMIERLNAINGFLGYEDIQDKNVTPYIDIWGNYVLQTPKGFDPKTWNMFNMFNPQYIEEGPQQEIWRLMKKFETVKTPYASRALTLPSKEIILYNALENPDNGSNEGMISFPDKLPLKVSLNRKDYINLNQLTQRAKELSFNELMDMDEYKEASDLVKYQMLKKVNQKQTRAYHNLMQVVLQDLYENNKITIDQDKGTYQYVEGWEQTNKENAQEKVDLSDRQTEKIPKIQSRKDFEDNIYH